MNITSNKEFMPGVFQDIKSERVKQFQKWREQTHAPEVWLSILTEEVGEAAKAMLNLRFGIDRDLGERLEQLRTEVLHTAAVATAMLEGLNCLCSEENL